VAEKFKVGSMLHRKCMIDGEYVQLREAMHPGDVW